VAAHEDVRRFAARLLGDVPRAGVAEALATCLEDEDAEVRAAAADSLARLGAEGPGLPEPVVATLARSLATAGRDERLSLVRAVGTAAGPDAVAALIQRLSDEDSFVRTEAARALAGREEAEAKIEGLLDDPDPGVRLAAATALAAAGARALEPLIEFAFAFEGYHRREAGYLMRRVDADKACARFAAVLHEPERRREWPVAIEALEELRADHMDVTRGET
jgi:HEAT repeat protein